MSDQDQLQGIVLAGGEGTRLRPSTRAVNKHLLPVYDRPMIHLPLQTLRDAGVDDVIVVTGRGHVPAFERVLGDGASFGFERLRYAEQTGSGGIADALGCARPLVTRDRLMVLLGDNVFGSSLREQAAAFTRSTSGARFVLYPCPEDQTHAMGVTFLNGKQLTPIVEKPSDTDTQDTASNQAYAVTGCYFYPADVFDVIASSRPSPRGELEITDINNHYINNQHCTHHILEGYWGDAGTPEGLYQAAHHVRAQRLKAPPRG